MAEVVARDGHAKMNGEGAAGWRACLCALCVYLVHPNHVQKKCAGVPKVCIFFRQQMLASTRAYILILLYLMLRILRALQGRSLGLPRLLVWRFLGDAVDVQQLPRWQAR